MNSNKKIVLLVLGYALLAQPGQNLTANGIQKQLTLLPKAHHAKVVFIPIPHSLYEAFEVQLFDEQGNKIAGIEGSGTSFEVGDPIGETCIEFFADYVANPDILQSLKIIERTQVPNGAKPALTNQPLVPQALYAEMRSIPGADGCGRICIRIYKGAATTIDSIHHNEDTAPTVCFFDEQGNELIQETHPGGRSSITEDINEMVQDIQSRLTVLPVAHHAKVVFFRIPYDIDFDTVDDVDTSDDGECVEFFNVQLFDETGNKIAQVRGRADDGSFGIIKVGDPIPQACIEDLKVYVKNPEILGSLKIIERIQGQNPDVSD